MGKARLSGPCETAGNGGEAGDRLLADGQDPRFLPTNPTRCQGQIVGSSETEMSSHAVPIPTPAPLIKNGDWASVLTQDHPRLLGPTGFLAARAAKYPELYQEVKQVDSLLAQGIVHAVEGLPKVEIEKWVAKGLSELDRGVTNRHQDTWIWLARVALTYDFFHAHLSPADRERMLAWMNPHLEFFTDDESGFHNSITAKIVTYLRIAYGTWGENPRAQDFRDYALEKLYAQRLAPVLREFGQGGGWTECGWYQRHSVWDMVHGMELARRVEGYDGYQQAPQFYYQRLAYELHQPYPVPRPDGTERFAVEGDGVDWYSPRCENTHLLRDVLADYFRGSELARLTANRARWPRHPRTLADELLFRPDQDQYPLPLEEAPLAHHAAGVGKVYARSDWTQDATWFRFECGDYFCAHQHFEVGNFELFRRDMLATESGHYEWGGRHAMNWFVRTIAHNCILINLPGETWARMRDGGAAGPYANDGGQTKKWEWPVSDLETWKSRREEFTTGKIIAYQNQPEFLYVAGDCTAAYVPEKLELWIRQIVFLRPHTFVIFDRVISTRPECRKTWLLHSRHEPELCGDAFSLNNGRGRLVGQRLLPEAAVVQKLEGYAYGGETFDPEYARHRDPPNRWRLEVSPAEPAREDFFLHLLTTDAPQLATLVRRGEAVGVQFGEVEVLFAGEVGGTLRLGGAEFPLEPVVRSGKYE